LRAGLQRDAALAGTVLRGLLNMLLPPRCLACRCVVAQPDSLCAACWLSMRFIAAPLCERCGLPLELAPPPGSASFCACPPHRFSQARSVLVYDDACRPMILGLKYTDATHLAPGFAAWMARAGSDILADADLLAPVPLHRWRLLKRRYNQAALLAQGVGRRCGVSVLADLLIRRRPTRPQEGLTRAGRRRNVRGAFVLRPRYMARVAGKRVVLIDDVLTTGATLDECARALLAAGAAEVCVLTLARVPLSR
jgi:ComF family protein